MSAWKFDRGLLLIVFFFLGLGVVHVYSSSYIFAIEAYDKGLFFFARQLAFAGLALMVLLTALLTPLPWLKRGGVALWCLAVIGVLLTFVPGLGVEAGGARRWIAMPFGLRIEPSEFLKISYPFVIGGLLLTRFATWPLWLWAVVIAAVLGPALLLLGQPDFGGFAICLVVVFTVLFVFGLRWSYIMVGASAMLCAFSVLIVNEPYRYRRLLSFLDPWADPEQKGFQVIQSMVSFRSGRLFGVGVGEGQGKLFFLPEAHTDFALAVLGEEWGFIGFFIVLSLYGYVFLRGLQIALASDAPDDKAIAVGITTVLAISTFINIGVVLGLLPTKGLTLPFLSYGGSSLVAVSLAVGVLLAIDRHNRNQRVISSR
jgi:cell division protein FtsW